MHGTAVVAGTPFPTMWITCRPQRRGCSLWSRYLLCNGTPQRQLNTLRRRSFRPSQAIRVFFQAVASAESIGTGTGTPSLSDVRLVS